MADTVKSQLQKGVNSLLDLSVDDLVKELGVRLTQTEDEVRSGAALTAVHPAGPTIDTAKLQGVGSVIQNTAKKFLVKFNRQMYSLICDKDDKDSAVIREAFKQGSQAVAYAIAGAFVASFAWLPAIATVLAVIVVKRAGSSAYDAFCESWRQEL